MCRRRRCCSRRGAAVKSGRLSAARAAALGQRQPAESWPRCPRDDECRSRLKGRRRSRKSPPARLSAASARRTSRPSSRSTAFSRMQGRRHRQGPGRSGDLQILDAGLGPLHAADLSCAASAPQRSLRALPLDPAPRIPPNPRIGGRSPGPVDMRSGCQRRCRDCRLVTLGWPTRRTRSPWRPRVALVILRSNERSVATSSGVRESVARPGTGASGARPVAGRWARWAGGVLVVHGEPGIGKTALLECAVERGREFRVAGICGVESEMELAFAALQQLCCPYLELMERLPEPQRDALAVAFGLGAGPASNSFLVEDWRSSACSPRLPTSGRFCASSMTRSGSIARPRGRWPLWGAVLLAEKIALVFATRELGEELRGLPDLEVRGLSDGDARALLSSVVPFLLRRAGARSDRL